MLQLPVLFIYHLPCSDIPDKLLQTRDRNQKKRSIMIYILRHRSVSSVSLFGHSIHEIQSLNHIYLDFSTNFQLGKRCLYHTCSACPSVHVELALSIAENGQLTCCARYEASLSASSRPIPNSLPVCCYRNLSSLFYDSPLDNCNTCCARVLLPRPAASSDSRVVEVTRFLGRGAWLADSESKAESGEDEFQWWRQCRRESSSISK